MMNTGDKNYFAENVFDTTPGYAELMPGLNHAGTGDRSNVAF
jgi:hypothetical protein